MSNTDLTDLQNLTNLNNSIIPKRIFQTHKSAQYVAQHPDLLKAMKSWVDIAKREGFTYHFYDNNRCNQFMQENFDDNVNKAYNKLPMGVMKADLWRYCVIYKYGGIYSDIDTVCRITPNLFINDTLLNVSVENNTPWFCQWCFSAPLNSPILKEVIDLSVERILEQPLPIKGEHIIHYLTGPTCFTDGVLNYFEKNDIPIYNDMHQYLTYPSNVFRVFEPTLFHDNFIIHLHAGNAPDGWKNERYNVLI